MPFNIPDYINPAFGGVAGADPLGIALKDRAQQARQQQHLAEMDTGDINHRQIGGPLPDPAWEGLMQAMAERGVNRASLGGGTAALGSTAGVGQTPITEQSNNFASPFHGKSLDQRADLQTHLLPGYGGPEAALTALKQAMPSYQSHEEWMADNAPAPGQWSVQATTHPGAAYRRGGPGRVTVADQRGTSGMNTSQRYNRNNPNE